MDNNSPNNQPEQSEKATIKVYNRWLAVLIAFIIVYSISMVFFIQKKVDDVINKSPVVMIDPATGLLSGPASLTNLFIPKLMTQPLTTITNAANPQSLYEQKSVYKIKDFVIINYFFIEGIVVAKDGNNYTVLYKDNNHTLQTIIVPRELLLSPTSAAAVNPFSLIIE
jgi:hypothetical protein